VMATLRSGEERLMEEMVSASEAMLAGLGSVHRLEVETSWTEEFPVTANDPEAVRIAEESAGKAGLEVETLSRPFSWSEDFGHFTSASRGALIGIGAGEGQPALHHPRYDFPDALLEKGTKLLVEVIRRALA